MRYEVVCKNSNEELEDFIYMGGENPKGDRIEVNTKYLIFNGKPWMPVMGEFHYARYNAEDWEEALLKMKAAGITLVATYLFWIHHEEEEGIFDFLGARDVRTFIETCQKHGLYVLIRVGPWCHGECRNGGFPDWLEQKGIVLRSNDPAFLAYTERIFRKYYEELDGLLFKDGGPIIGLQVENEKTDDAGYLLRLKQVLVEIGFEVPFYTVTGWAGEGIADFPEKEVLPVFGGYPEAPWEQHTNKLNPSMNYFFTEARNDSTIGTDQIKGKTAKFEEDLALYPYFTCELGAGVQNTYHRRPIIEPVAGYAISLVKLGNGNNLPGYYVFHGGSNPGGKLGFYQESKVTGYPNDLPVISYDFQTALGEGGIIRESYHYLRMLHLFVDSFGQELATMTPSFGTPNPISQADTRTTRLAIRQNQGKGFVFVNRFQRGEHFEDEQDVQFSVVQENEVINIPHQPVNLPKDVSFIWPFNLTLKDICLKYITAQPICTINNENEIVLFVAQCKDVPISLEVYKENIKEIKGAVIKETEENIVIENCGVGKEHCIWIGSDQGRVVIVPLLQEEALSLYKGKVGNQENVVLSQHPVYFKEGKIQIAMELDRKSKLIDVFPKLIDGKLEEKGNVGVFKTYQLPAYAAEESMEIQVVEQGKQIDNNPYLEYLFTQNLEGCKEYKLKLPKEIFEMYEGVELEFKVQGDVMQFYSENKLIGDYFVNGDKVRVELRRWKKLIEQGKKILIKCSPMEKDAQIYLEADVERQRVEVELTNIKYKKVVKDIY